jgi:hypothetical protein
MFFTNLNMGSFSGNLYMNINRINSLAHIQKILVGQQ